MDKVIDYKTLMASYSDFSRDILSFVKQLGLDVLHECDHLALRVNSVALADELRDHFLQHGTLISDKQINGRPILLIRLQQPMSIGHYQIPYLELPYPKETNDRNQGWEHIELVLPCHAETCEALQQVLFATVPNLETSLNKNPQISIKFSSPAGADERLANPTIAFKFKHLCVKVHPHSIETIINSEKADID